MFAKTIQSFSKNKICILVTHDNAIASICDEVYRLEEKHLNIVE